MDLLSITYIAKDWAEICMFCGIVCAIVGIMFIFISLEDNSKKAWLTTAALFTASLVFVVIPALNEDKAIKKEYYVSDETKIDAMAKEAYKYTYDNKILTLYINEDE